MNIFIYSDESGVFDNKNYDFYVFGGLIYLSKENRDECVHKYLEAERTVRKNEGIPKDIEVKAAGISNENKSKLYRSLNHYIKFGTVIRLPKVYPELFDNKKTKQRYLDYAYKIGIKARLQQLIAEGLIAPDDVENMYFNVDEHTTATNGRYELREALEQEFKIGTYNWNFMKKFPPLFPKLHSVELNFCNSSTVTLVRAADIVANKIYYMARNGISLQDTTNSLGIKILP